MFESLAGMVMATKLHFAQMEIPFIKKRDRVVAEKLYQNEVNKIEETIRIPCKTLNACIVACISL